MKALQSLANSIIINSLYLDHWSESIERRCNRRNLQYLNDKKFWKTSEARERRLSRRELKAKNEKFFLKTCWHLESFFNSFKGVKERAGAVVKCLRGEVEMNKQHVLYLYSIDKSIREYLKSEFFFAVQVRRDRKKSTHELYERDNWHSEIEVDGDEWNIFHLQELYDGYPSVPVHPMVISVNRTYRKFELEAVWGPFTSPENVMNLRELFGGYS